MSSLTTIIKLNKCLYRNFRSKNWFKEYLVLRKSFVFWVIIYRVVDGAFKEYSIITKVLTTKLSKEREL
ncbi:unnamed protein product [Penicillium salamii]|nr:unnamed protein product [Penicillium salamii]CAG8221346.1 unnamed protein product [Penicillium salamii]CAG8330178.1 unnamed protein product [Penicillium salamii]